MRLVLAGLMIHMLVSCGHGGDSGVVRLAIENASGMGIRCVAMLAHFVTVDRPVLASGDTHHLVLQRQSGGGLSFGAHDGEPMMLENLLCGTDSAWSASVQDLPLLALRSDEREPWSFRCTADGSKLACEP